MRFRNHLEQAHTYWKEILSAGDLAIDATCGNGYDTAVLAKLNSGHVIGLDIQPQAIAATAQRLKDELPEEFLKNIRLVCRCHSSFPDDIQPGSVKLIVYNLGYLPGGDKSRTTRRETTMESLRQALKLIRPGGMVSVMCYPGHPEGKEEEAEILRFASQLDQNLWICCHHRWLRENSPNLLSLHLRGMLSNR